MAPDRLAALHRVAAVESIGASSRLDGGKLGDLAVEWLVGFGPGTKVLGGRDEQEAAGYAEALEAILRTWQTATLSQTYIRQLHRDLLAHSDKTTWHRGNYKNLPNPIPALDADGKQAGILFETASPFDTPRLMTELTAWRAAAREQRQLHPLLLIAVFNAVFLEIHPMQEGNGRLARLLTTLLLQQAGYAYIPYASLDGVLEQDRAGYLQALRQTQTTIRRPAPDWQPWLLFFLRALHRQMQGLAATLEREKAVLRRLPDLSLRVVDHAREHGRVSVGDMIRLTGASRNTLKQQLRLLVDNGHLARHGGGRSTWYTLP